MPIEAVKETLEENPITSINREDFNAFQEFVYEKFLKKEPGLHWFYSRGVVR